MPPANTLIGFPIFCSSWPGVSISLPENQTSYGSMTSPLDQNSARSGQKLGFP
jgi:hypothetical protein